MIRYLEKGEKDKSRALWEQAFPEDSQSFIDYYYEEKIKDNRILAIVEDEYIVSMLHRNPYILAAGTCTWKCDYIVGVATDNAYRRRGYMRKLMEKCLLDMQREHMPFCFLMPAFEALYLPFDFTYVYAHQELELNEAGQRLEKKDFRMTDREYLSQQVNRWLKRRYQMYAIRDSAYMERLDRELQSEKGYIELLYAEKDLAGVRAFWGLKEKEQRLLIGDWKYMRKKGIPKPCIMGRIVHLQEFVKAVKLREEIPEKQMSIPIEVGDSMIPENRGKWLWYLDKQTSRLDRHVPSPCDFVQIKIQELTAWLTGYAVLEKMKLYADKIQIIKGVFLDEVV